jgi:hypothetical protein
MTKEKKPTACFPATQYLLPQDINFAFEAKYTADRLGTNV